MPWPMQVLKSNPWGGGFGWWRLSDLVFPDKQVYAPVHSIYRMYISMYN